VSQRQGAERAVLVTVALGALLAPLNSTMIAVALPRIIDDFDTLIPRDHDQIFVLQADGRPQMNAVIGSERVFFSKVAGLSR